jgi:putative FmdB family regulatory protein
MATYQYRCAEHGLLETSRPMGSAPQQHVCPVCGGQARRVFSAPLLALADRRAVALIDATEKTREAPEVVGSLPPRPRSTAPVTAHPAQRRLPRP